jgi:phage shock protein PspC (stress-responsive transcriptional regulator)
MCGPTCRAHALRVSATQGPSGAARIEDTVKDFWATRPRRPRRGRKIAGVAAGIGNRYRIDPVLVRVGFAVAAIYGGSGVLVYLLGWLFLPEQDDEVSPVESLFGKGRSSTSSAFTLLLGLVLLPVSGWFFSGAFTGEFSSWLSLLVFGGFLFLLHQARGGVTPVTPGSTAPPPPPNPMPTMPVPPMPTMPLSTPVAGPTMPYQPYTPPAEPPAEETPAPEQRTTPPAWDPLGAAPFAWDLPEPSTPVPVEEPEPPVKRRKPRVGMATLGIVLVTAATLGIIGSAPEFRGGWINPPHVIGIALAIIGLGLVFGAFRRAGRGLILLAVPLSLAGMGLTAVDPGPYRGIGDLRAAPTSLAAVQPVYERSAGTIELDLTGLPESGIVETEVHTDLGTVEVYVPQNADVIVTCTVDTGTVECLNQQGSGPGAQVYGYEDDGADGPGGLRIHLEASTNAGTVEVHRG